MEITPVVFSRLRSRAQDARKYPQRGEPPQQLASRSRNATANVTSQNEPLHELGPPGSAANPPIGPAAVITLSTQAQEAPQTTVSPVAASTNTANEPNDATAKDEAHTADDTDSNSQG
jgi:hypothetical protein